MGARSKLRRKKKADLTLHILICFIIGIYPLLLFKLDLGNFSFQQLILFLSIMGVLFYSFLLIRSNQWKLNFLRNRIDLTILILFIYALLHIIIKMVSMTETKTVRFEDEIMILSMVALYLLVTARPSFSTKYFDILLFSGLIWLSLFLLKYLFGNELVGVLTFLLQDNSGIISYAILVCMAGVWQYCKCENRLRSIFYIGVLSIGFFVLFINKSMISIWLMIIVFITIPIMQRTTAELVKRDMQIFFLFLFMLCNMSLLVKYTNLLRVDVNYNLKQSFYLELLAVIGGIFFIQLWDRIPEGIDLKRLVMRKMRRGYQFLLILTASVFIGILLGGDSWSNLPDGAGMNAVKAFTVPLVEEMRQGRSAFYQCFERLGVVGGTLILILWILLIIRLRNSYDLDKPVTGMLILISCIFLIQFLFWNLSMNALPAYWVFIVFAISYKEDKIKVISNKVKFE